MPYHNEEHYKEIKRFWVQGDFEAPLRRNDKHFKKEDAAHAHAKLLIKQGYSSVKLFRNTTIHRTERIWIK